MDVLKRRMFQEGGPVNVIESEPFYRGARVPTIAGTESLEEFDDGNFYFVRRDNRGNLIGKPKLVNLELSPTRDPREALIRQQQNEGIDFGSKLLGSYTGGPFLLRPLIRGIGSGLQAFNKTKIPQKIGESFVRRPGIPGPVKKGEEMLTAPLELGPSSKFLLGSGAVAGAGALGAGLMTTEEDVLAEREALANFDDDLANLVPENKSDEKADQKVREAEDAAAAEQQKREEEQRKREEELIAAVGKALKIKDRKKRIDRITSAASQFYTPGMTRAEAMMSLGQQLGAATDKEKAEELAKELKRIEAAEKDQLDPDFIDEKKTEYIDQMTDIQERNQSIRFLDEIEELLRKDNVTGIMAWARQLQYNFSSVLNPDAKMDGKTAVEALLREIAVGSAEEVLGQSSGRLSDKDIELAKKLVSEIEGIKGITKSEESIRSILQRRRNDLDREVSKAQANADKLAELFAKYNIKPPSPSFTTTRGPTGQVINIGLEEALELIKS